MNYAIWGERELRSELESRGLEVDDLGFSELVELAENTEPTCHHIYNGTPRRCFKCGAIREN